MRPFLVGGVFAGAPALVALLLAACAGSPQPQWQTAAHDALADYQREYLAGNTSPAERRYERAKSAIASTGRLDLAARAALVRCGLGTAALDFDRCAGVAPLLADATAEDRAYAAFLDGRWDAPEIKSLAAPYRAIVAARDDAAQVKAMQSIEDPVSRLVAAGTLFRLARLSPDGVATAVDTASAEGLRRPLLAWLNVQLRLAQTAADPAAVATIRRRIELVAPRSDADR
ncbi:MAG TPA: hypothetical protein VFB20_10940 [Burkholderiales bacterium]|nr:hypothetical protein [Burkholderiales bacterium]